MDSSCLAGSGCILCPVIDVSGELRALVERNAYAVPVVIVHVLLLEGTLDLLLSILWKGIVAVDELHVHLRSLGPVVKDLRRHAAPSSLLAVFMLLRDEIQAYQ